MASRENDQNRTRHELQQLFAGKTMKEIATAIPTQYDALISRGWDPWSANNIIAFAIMATNRPAPDWPEQR